MSKLLFLATEDWFVRSHFLPLLRRAVADGHDVAVAARVSGALSDVPGVRVIDTPFARGSLKPWELGRQIAHLRALLMRERPDIIHAIALKPIGLLTLSHYLDAGRVLAITGRGFLGVGAALWTRLANWRLKRSIRAALDQPRTLLLVENDADGRWIDPHLDETRVLRMPGAGVDPHAFTPAPEPAAPIVVGVAARLVRSKGIDLAVDAIRTLRARGVEISLRIAGAVDADNPDHVSDAELARWRASGGVDLIGRSADINAFWAGVHIACLPSRGGEGLPRLLLEAAACGRPIVTTDVPGCADFVRDSEGGLIVPANDSAALAEALATLAADAPLRQRLGAAGRTRVLAAYTEAHAADVAARAWATVLRA